MHACGNYRQSKYRGGLSVFRLLTTPNDSILPGEDRQKSKASAPGGARLEPTRMLVLTKKVRRLYDLPVFTDTGTLSLSSRGD
ncbi:hypothetical protein YWA314_07541 [Yersinia enterocolitica subsp. enterocolitica WA-314]|nr:hypothetical protein YWA314_07541 [Yersinia enterocolitica subsp. enterocolitica WA-314]